MCSCLGLNLGKWIPMVVFVVKFWEKLLSDSIARVFRPETAVYEQSQSIAQSLKSIV